jgi:hypothetical protein
MKWVVFNELKESIHGVFVEHCFWNERIPMKKEWRRPNKIAQRILSQLYSVGFIRVQLLETLN